MNFNNYKEILEKLDALPKEKIRRTLYEIITSIEVININHLEHWEELVVSLMETAKYQDSQGLEHWFENLYYCNLKKNELLFLLPVILNEIDNFNNNVFWSLSEALIKNISNEQLNLFISKLRRHNSKLSNELANQIEYDL